MCLSEKLTSDPLELVIGKRVIVGIEALATRGASVSPRGLECPAALHSEAHKMTSGRISMFIRRKWALCVEYAMAPL